MTCLVPWFHSPHLKCSVVLHSYQSALLCPGLLMLSSRTVHVPLSQQRHYGLFGWRIHCWGVRVAVLFIIGYLAASLPFSH